MRIFKKKTDKEYWININNIKIQPEFLETKIGYKKWRQKMNYFRRTGKFQSKIVLNQDNLLFDGYSSYKIAKEFGLGKLPVWYID